MWTMCPRISLASVLLLALLPAFSWAQLLSEGPLGDLYLAREGGIAHYSSSDAGGGNDDRRPIAPGETLTLVDHRGAGVVRRWWLTIDPRDNVEVYRTLIVRCYWDDEATPSVEVPVTDFFGMGFGEWKDYISAPLSMTSGGNNMYWPMPFRSRARITVENTGSAPVASFYYNLDVRTYENLPKDAHYFHAQYRQTRTERGRPVTILETEGRGHYVGTLLSMAPDRGNSLSYLEGDERIFIDGEETPSIIGTGTEDYFSSGWYYITGEYSAPYHGVTIKDEERGRINTYRWHIEDPIPFKKSFRFEIEHGGENDAPGVDYSSVAFWYQSHPHVEFPSLPGNLIPLTGLTAPSVEAEDLMEDAQLTGGELRIQTMRAYTGDWGSDAQLWWVEAKPGDRLTLPIEVAEAGRREVVGFFTRGPDYGIVRVFVNGTALGDFMDGYGRNVVSTGPVSFGRADLREGVNEITIELVGKDVRSANYFDGYLVGIDGFSIR